MIPKAITDYWNFLVGNVKAQEWSNPFVFAVGGGLIIQAFTGFIGDGASTVVVAFMAAFSALAGGSILGFLFGIPKTVQEPAQFNTSKSSLTTLYVVNTNLEQISDWLTKIIVGLTLLEIRPILDFLERTSKLMASIAGSENGEGYFAAEICYFVTCGFMLSYLWTRLYLTSEFMRTDRQVRQSPEFYEGLAQASLYQSPPNGFNHALEIAAEYCEVFGDDNWRIWRTVACANGQKYLYWKNEPNPSEESLRATKDATLRALNRLRALAPNDLKSVKSLWDKSETSPNENDLEVFFDDPDFNDFFQAWSRQLGQTE